MAVPARVLKDIGEGGVQLERVQGRCKRGQRSDAKAHFLYWHYHHLNIVEVRGVCNQESEEKSNFSKQ